MLVVYRKTQFFFGCIVGTGFVKLVVFSRQFGSMCARL